MAPVPPGFGWHRLDPWWAARLVAESAVGPGARVVDVGAGHGAVTAPLVEVGARVVAVENHPGRARHLRQRFGNEVVVVEADARSLRLPRRPFHVVANPPFSVTTALLGRLLQPGSRLLSVHVVVQEQAARRWAGQGAPGARRWQRTFEVSIGPRIPRSAFRPPPRVDARILVIRRRPGR